MNTITQTHGGAGASGFYRTGDRCEHRFGDARNVLRDHQ